MSEEEKPNEPSQDELLKVIEKIEAVTRHIENVKDSCLLLGRRLILKGEVELGKQLIAHGYIHDNSKFYGIEWDYLGEKGTRAKLDLAIYQHNTSPSNKHHPEAWGEEGIEAMPRIFLAELVCDWKSRASEFATDLREWVDEGAMVRFGYKKNSRVYKEIMYFVDLLCDKPFKQKKITE